VKWRGNLAACEYRELDDAATRVTHAALIHHYAASAIALDMRTTERQLHALPLYHSAQMHVFMMPSLMLGAPNWLLEAPDPVVVLEQGYIPIVDRKKGVIKTGDPGCGIRRGSRR
jgi:hypothetical protein